MPRQNPSNSRWKRTRIPYPNRQSRPPQRRWSNNSFVSSRLGRWRVTSDYLHGGFLMRLILIFGVLLAAVGPVFSQNVNDNIFDDNWTPPAPSKPKVENPPP